MKKLLTLLTIVGLTTTITTTVVACGKDILVTRINLDTVLKNLTVASDTTVDNVIDAVLSLPENSDAGVEAKDLEVESGSFVEPSYTEYGSATIVAKVGTKYTGSVQVTIDVKPKDLNALNLETTVAVSLTATQEEVFQSFLDKNNVILEGGNLTLDQVKLSGFKAPQYIENGELTILTPGTANAWTGMIKITIKYILTGDNFEEIFRYLSDNDLLHFNVPVGYVKTMGDLASITRDKLNNEMKRLYDYDSNISQIRLNSWAWRDTTPTLEQLNTPGFVCHLSNFFAEMAIDYVDGTTKLIAGNWDVTWTIVEN